MMPAMTTRDEAHRPHFHYTPARHWINDPNGLVWFEGEYHLFYQTNPYGNQWGHMSWGHAVGNDLVHWQELPVAIPEDEQASIYSGSVVVDTLNTSGLGEHGRPPLVALYTGCLRRPEGGQAQYLAHSTDRGRTWTKYAGNPVLDLGLRDFRDPKVFWHAPTARWVMVVVVPDDRCAKFFASADLKTWTWLSDFSAPFEGQGIWECPDLIPLPMAGEPDTWLFKVDVFGGHPSGGTGARIFCGRFDGTRFHAEPEAAPRWADLGADFYAALSWAALPNAPARQVWLAWMSCHRYAQHTPTTAWRGAMTVPRELKLRRGGALGWQLLQQPVAELQALRGPADAPADLAVNDAEVEWPGSTAAPAAYELACVLEPGDATACGLLLHRGAGVCTRVGLDVQRGTVFIDRGNSGWTPPDDPVYAQRHEAPVPAGPVRLRVLVDTASVEVFVGDGEITLTDAVFPPEGALGLGLYAAGGTARFGSLCRWPLARARITPPDAAATPAHAAPTPASPSAAT